VRLVSTPVLAEDLRRTGLPAVPLGGPPRHSARFRRELTALIWGQPAWPVDWALAPHLLTVPQRRYLAMLGTALVRVAEAMVDPLVAFARQWRPHLVVHDAISYAGAVAAAALRVPGVRHVFGTASMPRLELRVDDGQPLPEYVRLFERFGLDPLAEPALAVDPTPVSMRFWDSAGGRPVHTTGGRPPSGPARVDIRYVPYNGAGAQPGGLTGRRRPRICVTWGHTVAGALGAAAADPYRDVVTAVAGLAADIVVVSTAAQIAALGELPRNVRTMTSVPLQLVLPYCDAIVQQGGDGTTLTAAALGVPQLAITRKPDAEIAAGRLAAVGAGIHLPMQKLRARPDRADVVRSAVGRLLADGAHRDAAHTLRAEIASAPAPANAVRALASLDGG
jgi:glycosyltransferase